MSDFSDAKVGDRVWSITEGWGRVEHNNKGGSDDYPIKVIFRGGYGTYTIGGLKYEEDMNPTLFWDEVKITPPSKPKRKIKKKLEGWVNVYPNGFLSYVHKSKDEADSSATSLRIACVYVNEDYELEE